MSFPPLYLSHSAARFHSSVIILVLYFCITNCSSPKLNATIVAQNNKSLLLCLQVPWVQNSHRVQQGWLGFAQCHLGANCEDSKAGTEELGRKPCWLSPPEPSGVPSGFPDAWQLQGSGVSFFESPSSSLCPQVPHLCCTIRTEYLQMVQNLPIKLGVISFSKGQDLNDQLFSIQWVLNKSEL